MLRVVHIVGGAFWFGAAVVFAAFIEPTAAEIGPSAGPLMQHIAQKKAAAAIAAWLVGFIVLRPGIDRLANAAASGSPKELARIQRTLRSGSMFNVLFLAVAVIAMASARYL